VHLAAKRIAIVHQDADPGCSFNAPFSGSDFLDPRSWPPDRTIFNRDFPVLHGIVLLMAVAVLVVNLLTDVVRNDVPGRRSRGAGIAAAKGLRDAPPSVRPLRRPLRRAAAASPCWGAVIGWRHDPPTGTTTARRWWQRTESQERVASPGVHTRSARDGMVWRTS
jgi:hypothetical protein